MEVGHLFQKGSNKPGAVEVVSGFGNITNMQQMTGTICSNASVGFTTRLMDIRDNKWYWVTKLKDGNCWMTQNLDLDLDTTKPLTSTDSDVSNWTPTANTLQGTITKFPGSSDLTFSYNPGEYVYTTPAVQNNCGTSGITSLNNCPNWVNVSRLSPSTDPDYAEVIGDSNSTYSAHYLAGNYYSYNVATAGTAPSAAGTATSSICPKGWQLPTSNSTTASKSFGYLLNGLTVVQITTSPYYFVYGGRVNNSSLEYAGNNGLYWSSTAFNGSLAHLLNFDTYLYPSNGSDRYRGMSVRCVAR